MKADKKYFTRYLSRCRWMIFAVAMLLATGALAQTVDMEQLLRARETSALLERDGLVIGGLKNGGLVFWDVADPASYERLTSGSELSGNNITDLAWTGRNVWVATMGGGLTRINDVAGSRQFRQYIGNLSSLNVNAVTGTLIGQSERVYYGTDGDGVGVITDGLSGAVYTAEQDGLISNTVTAVQILDGDLFVGTPVGISRFANNFFSNQNTGLTSLEIHDLTLDSDGRLLAGTEEGVFRWDTGSESWALVGSDVAAAIALSTADGLIYVLGTQVRVFNGASWQVLARPSGTTSAIHAGTRFWIGGALGAGSGSEFVVRPAYLGRLGGGTSFDLFTVDASQVLSAAGVTFSGGDPYLGGQAWQSVVSSRHDGTWEHLRYQADTPENEGDHLSAGIILSMTTGSDGVVWTGLYAGTGLARTDPATGVTDLINPTTSGLLGKSIVNVVAHPDGPLLTLHDWVDTEKVEILVDPGGWADAANWMFLPRAGGLGEGPSVWDAVVQRRDVVWFAVEAVGLVRWDINGDQAGPDDPLTWLDQSDDRWDAPLTGVFGSQLDLRVAFGLAVGPDGSIWAGGNGLVQFSYDEQSREATLLSNVPEKTSPLFEGLISGNVADITRDANGHIWVATAKGVNRVRGTGSDVTVDAYIDLANYFGNPVYGTLYSPNVIAPLPGNQYRKITASADGKQVLVSADQGVSLITVGSSSSGGGEEVAENKPFLFPNPFTGDLSDGGLKLGGLITEGTARVEIYNLDGQLVYADDRVTQGTGFWAGTTRTGVDVASGLYAVRVVAGDKIWTLTLAVVR